MNTKTQSKTADDSTDADSNKLELSESLDVNSPLSGLSDKKISEIEEALLNKSDAQAKALITDLSVVDSAELLEKLSDEFRQQILDNFSDTIEPETFAELDPELLKPTLEDMDAQEVADIISELKSDDALYIIEELPLDFQQEIIKKLSAKTRVTLQEGLNFPEDSAGRLMQREFVAIPQFWTVEKTLDYLREAGPEIPDDFFDLFIVSPTYHVIGEIPLSTLVKTKKEAKVEALALDEAHPIPANMDQEEVAQIFRRENLLSAPVVDEDERLIGVITIDDVVDVIDEEAQEDILKMAGVDTGDLYRAVLSTSSSRFRWLFLNLLTALLASIVISFFDATIKELVALAVLMPIVASMGGNAGTQALTVAVRALATKELSQTNALRVIWKETLVGTFNGLSFAIIMGVIAALWFDNNMLGAVIAAAMTINLIFAGIFGASIPIFLERSGSDPAVSSTVLLTTVTDIVGFFSFLGLSAIFLI
jgi:magnesium transporter